MLARSGKFHGGNGGLLRREAGLCGDKPRLPHPQGWPSLGGNPMRTLTIRAIIVGLLASGISGCATWYVMTNMQELQAHIQGVNVAWDLAGVRLDKMCSDDPASCRVRLMRSNVRRQTAYINMTPEQRLKSNLYERKQRPPYRVIFAVHEEELRNRTQPRLAEEYLLGVGRMLADLLDDGKKSEEEAFAVWEEAENQRSIMIREDIRMLQESYKVAQEEDRVTLEAFSVLVDVAATGLNAYAARLPAHTPAAVQPATTIPRYYSAPSRPPSTTVQCTYRLNALAGMMLCVNSDGRVVAQ